MELGGKPKVRRENDPQIDTLDREETPIEAKGNCTNRTTRCQKTIQTPELLRWNPIQNLDLSSRAVANHLGHQTLVSKTLLRLTSSEQESHKERERARARDRERESAM